MRGLEPERPRANEGVGGSGNARPERAASRIEFKGTRTGPVQHALVRREPHCDGQGRQGLRRLGEGSGERNEDSDEDEGAEAHRAVHRLVGKR